MKDGGQRFYRGYACGKLLSVVAFLAIACVASVAQGVAFQLDPQHTTINYTLGDALHTVHGTFRLKQGTLRLDRSSGDPASGRLAGEIIVDARSGQSGSEMRDHKMHREVLESDRYPEITFRPDRVDGIHGSDHELTIPAEVEVFPDHWTATLHFAVPYANWGMKNPSTFFLRVSESVDIDLTTGGTVVR
jgi:polyisoprenoid-binding protein YceI